MSSTSKSLTLNYDNINTYRASTNGSVTSPYDPGSLFEKQMMYVQGSNSGSITLNNSAKNQLFPNDTAKPIKCDITYDLYTSAASTITGSLYINNSKVSNDSTLQYKASLTAYEATKTQTNITLSGSTSTKKADTTISLGVEHTGSLGAGGIISSVITLYFTRYDFSAAAGTGIASASVSAANGYDGDSITFTATPALGYRFDHWSDGSTDNPHTITVSGADKTLTAYGASTGKNLSVLYGNSIIVNETVSGNVTVSIGTTLGNLPFTLSDGAKTLDCKGKYMPNNITVGAKTLLCKDKIVSYNIPILLCYGEWETNTALNNATSGISAANGWVTTPLLKLPTGCTNITIECGGAHSGYSCLHELDANGGYLSYWGAANNPRTFTFDYPTQIKYIRASFLMANLANCYIKDNTHNVYIFRGG